MSANSIKEYIKENYQPVEGKPGYVWFSKRNFAIISIETLEEALIRYEASVKEVNNEKNP